MRAGDQRVVRPLAVLDTDRVDRRHVDDVEAHVGDGVEALRGGAEVAGGPLTGFVVADGAFGARKEFVPGAAARELALHQQRVRLGDCHEFADGLAFDDVGHLGAEAGGEAFLGCQGGVGEDDDGHPQRPAVRGGARGVLGGFRQQRRAFGQHEFDVDAGLHLDLGVVVPGAVAVVPGLDDEGPVARGGRGQEAFPAVGAHPARSARRGEADPLPLLAAGIEQDGADAELVVSLTEHGGPHHNRFARDSFGGKLSALYRWLHGGDRKAAKTQAIRDQGLGLLLGHGTGSRVIRHRLDVIYKTARMLRPRPFPGGFPALVRTDIRHL